MQEYEKIDRNVNLIILYTQKLIGGFYRVICRKIMAFVLAGILLLTALPGAVFAQELPTVKLSPTANQADYRLSKYDLVNIVIIGYSDNAFNDVMIGPDGYLNLPYAGAVKLSGLTVAEATQVLTQRLGEYIKIPGMSIMVKQYGPRKVYVLGEVQKAGIYSLSSDYMNVFAALSSAGGITKRGRTKKIAIVRVENGKVNLQEVDIKKFIEKQDITQNIALQDGDMIYVPNSGRIDFNEDILPLINTYAVFRSLTN